MQLINLINQKKKSIKISNKYLKVSATSISNGDISTPIINTKKHVNESVAKTTSSDISSTKARTAYKLETYTKTETHSQINNSFKAGVLRLQDDDATERQIII